MGANPMASSPPLRPPTIVTAESDPSISISRNSFAQLRRWVAWLQMPTQPPLHVSVTQNSSEQQQHQQNNWHLALRTRFPGLPWGFPRTPLPLHPQLVQGMCWEVSPFPTYCFEIFAILMNPTYLVHINEIVTETCPFTGISGKLPLNRLTKFLTSPDNIYLLITHYHHLEPPCHPANEREAHCRKPTDLSESVLWWLQWWWGANNSTQQEAAVWVSYHAPSSRRSFPAACLTCGF